MTTQPSLLDRLVAEELTLQHCREMQAEIDAQARGGPALRRQFNFNCYEIEIDFDFETGHVLVLDVLNVRESGRQMVSLEAFVDALRRFESTPTELR